MMASRVVLALLLAGLPAAAQVGVPLERAHDDAARDFDLLARHLIQRDATGVQPPVLRIPPLSRDLEGLPEMVGERPGLPPSHVPLPTSNPLSLVERRDSTGLLAAVRRSGIPFRSAADGVSSWITALVSPVVEREDWDATPPAGSGRAHTPASIVIHHSDGHEAHDEDALEESMRTIEYSHQQRGFRDVGYHFGVADGYIAEGREVERSGAHVEGRNMGRIGVVFLGNFNDQAPTGPQVLAFVRLATDLAVRYDMDVDAEDFLTGHVDHKYRAYDAKQGRNRWYNATDCPGHVLLGMLPSLRTVVIERVKAAREARAHLPAGG